MNYVHQKCITISGNLYSRIVHDIFMKQKCSWISSHGSWTCPWKFIIGHHFFVYLKYRKILKEKN